LNAPRALEGVVPCCSTILHKQTKPSRVGIVGLKAHLTCLEIVVRIGENLKAAAYPKTAFLDSTPSDF
jgi:hypothetical protein